MIIVPIYMRVSESDAWDYTPVDFNINWRSPVEWMLAGLHALIIGGGFFVITRILLQMYAGYGL